MVFRILFSCPLYRVFRQHYLRLVVEDKVSVGATQAGFQDTVFLPSLSSV